MKSLIPVQLVKGTVLNRPARLEALARKARWLVRQPKKLKPVDFVQGLIAAVLEGGCCFRLLASSIGMRLAEKSAGGFDTVSKPGLWARVGPEASAFLKSVLAELVRERLIPGGSSIPAIPVAGRIIVEDSSALALDPQLAGECPASRNQHELSAGLRFQAAFDLVTGEPVRLSLESRRRNDQAASEDIVAMLRPGDLLVRDLGYFAIKPLVAIAEKGAHYLTRHFSNCVVSHPEEEGGGRIDLLRHLGKNAPSPGDIVDTVVVVGTGQKGTPKLATRLVARRVPKAVEEKRLRRLGQQEQQQGKTFSAFHRRLQAWEIYFTSLAPEQATAAEIFKIYPLRWRIEIIFKACKSHTSLRAIASHRSNVHHVKALLYAWVCALVLAARTGAFALALPAAPGGSGQLRANYLSLLKVVPKVFALLGEIMSASCAPPGEIIGRWLHQITYHDRYEPRTTRTNMAQMVEEALGFDSAESGSGVPPVSLLT